MALKAAQGAATAVLGWLRTDRGALIANIALTLGRAAFQGPSPLSIGVSAAVAALGALARFTNVRRRRGRAAVRPAG